MIAAAVPPLQRDLGDVLRGASGLPLGGFVGIAAGCASRMSQGTGAHTTAVVFLRAQVGAMLGAIAARRSRGPR